MPKHLLPPNATDLEIAADTVSEALEEFPVPLRDIWNPDTCPERLLPYLAWAFSVDRWDKDWPEQTKRDVINASMFVHQHKGTIGAIRRAIESLGYLIHIKEWWHIDSEPGTFQVNLGVVNTPLNAARYREIAALIFDAKPISRHLAGLNIEINTAVKAYWGAASFAGSTTTVYPYRPPLDPTRYPPLDIKTAIGFQLASATNQAKPVKSAVGMTISTSTLTKKPVKNAVGVTMSTSTLTKKPVKNAVGVTMSLSTTQYKPVKHVIGYLLVIKDIT